MAFLKIKTRLGPILTDGWLHDTLSLPLLITILFFPKMSRQTSDNVMMVSPRARHQPSAADDDHSAATVKNLYHINAATAVDPPSAGDKRKGRQLRRRSE